MRARTSGSRYARAMFVLTLWLAALPAAGGEPAGAPDSWSLADNGVAVLPLMELSRRPDRETQEREKAAWLVYADYIAQANRQRWPEAKEKLDQLLRDYADTATTATALEDYAKRLTASPDKKIEALAAAKELVARYPGRLWQANALIQELTQVKLDLRSTDTLIFTPDETPKVKVSAEKAQELTFAVYRIDPFALLRKNIDLLAPPPPAAEEKPLHSWTVQLKNQLGAPSTEYELPVKEPGAYLVSVSASEVRCVMPIFVSRIGVTVKTDGQVLLALVADKENGAAAGPCEVAVAESSQGCGFGATGENGLYAARLDAPLRDGVVVARRGEDWAVCRVNPEERKPDGLSQIFLAASQGTYMPGQRMELKAVLRRRGGDGALSFRPGEEIGLRISDRFGREIGNWKAAANEWGAATFAWDIPESVSPGWYRLEAFGAGAGGYMSIMVTGRAQAEYVVSVAMDRKWAVIGDKVRVTASAVRANGRKVKNTRLSYEIVAFPNFYYLPYMMEEKYRDLEWFARGANPRVTLYPAEEMVEKGHADLDESGVFEFVADTSTVGQAVNPNRFRRYDLVCRIGVEDSRRNEIFGAAEIPLNYADAQVELSTDRLCYRPGEKVRLLFGATDKSAPAAMPLKFEALLRDEKSAYQKVLERELKTGEDGRAELEFEPQASGQYRFQATVFDAEGKSVNRYVHAWCLPDDWSSPYAYYDMSVRTDRDLYRPGDEIRAVAVCKFADRPALFTLEDDRIRSWRLGRLRGSLAVAEFKVDAGVQPVARVTAAAFGKGFSGTDDRRIAAPATEKWLQVVVKPEKPEYCPGETAAFSVTVVDSNGKPARAELCFALATAASTRAASGTRPDIRQFFHGRENFAVDTFEGRLLRSSPGENAEEQMLRGKQGMHDPEYWNDDETLEAGQGDPDEVLRPGLPRTAPAVWLPSIVTDAEGRAVIKCAMPNHLASWRARVVAITSGDLVGQAACIAVTRQEIFASLAGPSACCAGDETTLLVGLSNRSGEEKQCAVKLELTGMTELANEQTAFACALPAGGAKEFPVRVKILPVTEAKATVSVVAGVARDEVSLSVPVAELSRQVEEFGKTIKLPESVKFDLPAGVAPETLRAELEVAPSLFASLLQSARLLERRCGHASTLDALHALSPYAHLKTLLEGGKFPEAYEAEADAAIRENLSRLLELQLPGGDWGWLALGAPDAALTAEVGYVLVRAAHAGYGADQVAVARLRAALEKTIPAAADPETKAELVRTYCMLSEQGTETLQALYPDREKFSGGVLGLLAQAAAFRNDGEKAKGFADVLEKKIETDGRLAHVGREVCATARALAALARTNPGNPLNDKMAEWLLEQRHGGLWQSDRESCAALEALADYLLLKSDRNPDFTLMVKVNGGTAAELSAVGGALRQSCRIFFVPAGLLRAGENRAEIALSGIGTAYLSLRARLPEKLPAARPAAGLKLAREYCRLAASGGKGEAFTGAVKVGDVVEVRLEVEAAQPLRYVIVEDCLAGGFDIIKNRPGSEPAYPDGKKPWQAEESSRSGMVFYFETLPAGKTKLFYTAAAVTPGKYLAAPARAFSQAAAGTEAASAAAELSVE